MSLKDKLKLYRKENKLTQKDLAEILGVSRSNIAEMEAGRIKGTLKTLAKLSEISGKGLEYWSEEDIIIKKHEALDILLNSMRDKKIIKDDGKIPKEYYSIVVGILEKELALDIENEKKKAD